MGLTMNDHATVHERDSITIASSTLQQSVPLGDVKRTILAGHSLFAGLPAAALEGLAGYARLEHAARGAIIFSKGDPGTGLMAVVAGAVKISVHSPEGGELVLNVIHPGEVFGEIALLDGRARSANAVAMSDSLLLTLERREFVPFVK